MIFEKIVIPPKNLELNPDSHRERRDLINPRFMNKSKSFQKLKSPQGFYQIEISCTWNLMTPAGACTSAVSPTFFPSNPLPMGDVMEIFPAFRSASFSLTILYVTSFFVLRLMTFTFVKID